MPRLVLMSIDRLQPGQKSGTLNIQNLGMYRVSLRCNKKKCITVNFDKTGYGIYTEGPLVTIRAY